MNDVLISQIIEMSNFRYGLVLLITSFILLGGAWTIYQVYKAFNMDVESKVFTNVFAFVLLCLPLYFWIDYREYFIVTEMARIMGAQ